MPAYKRRKTFRRRSLYASKKRYARKRTAYRKRRLGRRMRLYRKPRWGLPNQVMCRMSYVDTRQLIVPNPVGTITNYTYRANSIYNPNYQQVPANDHQPMFTDQFVASGKYKYATVMGAKISAQILSSDTNGMQLTYGILNSGRSDIDIIKTSAGSGASNNTTILEYCHSEGEKYHTWATPIQQPIAGGGLDVPVAPIRAATSYMSIPKFTKINRKALNDYGYSNIVNTTTQSVTAGPNVSLYFVFWYLMPDFCQTFAASPTINVRFTITYYVLWHTPEATAVAS